MAKRICLLTGNETDCTDGCYRCGCGGEVALNDCYVPIYNIQRVCDIVKNMANVSTEGEEISEYIRNELEKMVISAADVNLVISGNNCIVCGHDVRKDTVYYDVNGGTICESCMNTKCKCKNGR